MRLYQHSAAELKQENEQEQKEILQKIARSKVEKMIEQQKSLRLITDFGKTQ